MLRPSKRSVPQWLEVEIDDNIEVIYRKVDALRTARSQVDISTKGGCNRLNDFVHELQKFVNNLEARLEKAGKE